MNKRFFAVLIIASFAIGITATNTAFGQEITITEDIGLSTTQVAFVVGIGALAGTIRAWQGYDKSPDDFDLLRFVNGIRDNILVAIPIAFGAALAMPELHAVGYVMIFFAVMGAAGFAHKAKQTSIPSNASNEEIERILNERD